MFVLILFPIKISFEMCSKQLLTMRNRFLILPKPEKLNFNEFLRFKVLTTDENVVFPKNVENQFCNMLSYVKNAAKTAIRSVLSQTFQNNMFLPK